MQLDALQPTWTLPIFSTRNSVKHGAHAASPGAPTTKTLPCFTSSTCLSSALHSDTSTMSPARQRGYHDQRRLTRESI